MVPPRDCCVNIPLFFGSSSSALLNTVVVELNAPLYFIYLKDILMELILEVYFHPCRNVVLIIGLCTSMVLDFRYYNYFTNKTIILAIIIKPTANLLKYII